MKKKCRNVFKFDENDNPTGTKASKKPKSNISKETTSNYIISC